MPQKNHKTPKKPKTTCVNPDLLEMTRLWATNMAASEQVKSAGLFIGPSLLIGAFVCCLEEVKLSFSRILGNAKGKSLLMQTWKPAPLQQMQQPLTGAVLLPACRIAGKFNQQAFPNEFNQQAFLKECFGIFR